jgi:hypothetical protein
MNIRTLLAALFSMALATSSTLAYAQDASEDSSEVSTVVRHYVPLPVNSTLGPGAPLMKGLKDNYELADLIHASLQRDPSGNGKLDAARCRLNGSCATPNDYLTAIQTTHPKAGLQNVSQLEQHIRALVKIDLRSNGEFYSARMVGNKLDVSSGFHRKLEPGEFVYEDTQTGEDELLGNCGNVMWPVPLEEVTVKAARTCVPVDYELPELPPGAKMWVHFVVYGPKPLAPSVCFGLKQPGTAYEVLPTHCPIDVLCSFERALETAASSSDAVNTTWHFSGGYTSVAPGTHTIRLPIAIFQGNGLSVCVTILYPDGTQREAAKHIYFHITDRLEKGGGYDMGALDPMNFQQR